MTRYGAVECECLLNDNASHCWKPLRQRADRNTTGHQEQDGKDNRRMLRHQWKRSSDEEPSRRGKMRSCVLFEGYWQKSSALEHSPRMTIASDLNKTLANLGFPALIDVRGRNSIADLFTERTRRAGLYFLQFENGSCYIGQAIDPVRRFAQHRITVGGIAAYSFQPCHKAKLNDEERDRIWRAERSGLPLTNRVHVANIAGDRDLDLVISSEQQEKWLRGDPGLREPRPVRIPSDSALRRRTCQNVARLEADENYRAILACLRTFMKCVPFPQSTQLSFWSLSCLPSTGSGPHKRYAGVNAAMMEVLVVGGRSKETWGFVNVSRSLCLDRYGTLQELRRQLPSARLYADRAYRDAGQDQIRVETSSIEGLKTLLRQPAITAAAKHLMLRVMRARPTIYAKYHAPDLADRVLR